MGHLSRRLFLARFTKGSAAIAVLGTVGVACSGDNGSTTTTTASVTSTTTTAGDTPTFTTSVPASTSEAPATTEPAAGAPGVTLERVKLGSVSAYVLVRNGEAAVVDTGTPGNAGQIEAALTSLGLGWGDVGHVVLTHRHNDHIGSLPDVMAAAPGATGYAGAGDIPDIDAPRTLIAVGDGDRVFDLEVYETPGHTPGSISLLDPVGGILVVGDAMNGGDALGGEAGTVAGANPRFSQDLGAAEGSIRKLAGLDFEAIYFGHGEPVESGAGAAVRSFADSI
jgi:glyoxylase-like metal-dependent hydrolase (beta-lactamase superfamily II)